MFQCWQSYRLLYTFANFDMHTHKHIHMCTNNCIGDNLFSKCVLLRIGHCISRIRLFQTCSINMEIMHDCNIQHEHALLLLWKRMIRFWILQLLISITKTIYFMTTIRSSMYHCYYEHTQLNSEYYSRILFWRSELLMCNIRNELCISRIATIYFRVPDPKRVLFT